MILSIQHPIYGSIVYEEGAWSGKRSLIVNGVRAERISKKVFRVGDQKAVIKGSTFEGVTLLINGQSIQLSPKSKWYEIALAIIPFLFLLIWGNVPSLCMIFPVVGGALGGALGGACAIVSMILMRKQSSPIMKVVVGVISAVLTILIAFALAFALIMLSV